MLNDFELFPFSEPSYEVPVTQDIGFDPYLDLLPGVEFLGDVYDNQPF